MENLERLKELIKAELELCDAISTPTVCEMNTIENYAELERLIINKVAHQGLSIGQAIVELEKEYNINLID